MVLPDGTPVAVTTSLDATARIWDLATGQTRHVLTGHGGPVRAVATVLLPDGTEDFWSDEYREIIELA